MGRMELTRKGCQRGSPRAARIPWGQWCPLNPSGLCSRHLLAAETFAGPVTPSPRLIRRAVGAFGPTLVVVRALQKQVWRGGGWRDPRGARSRP